MYRFYPLGGEHQEGQFALFVWYHKQPGTGGVVAPHEIGEFSTLGPIELFEVCYEDQGVAHSVRFLEQLSSQGLDTLPLFVGSLRFELGVALLEFGDPVLELIQRCFELC